MSLCHYKTNLICTYRVEEKGRCNISEPSEYVAKTGSMTYGEHAAQEFGGSYAKHDGQYKEDRRRGEIRYGATSFKRNLRALKTLKGTENNLIKSENIK